MRLRPVERELLLTAFSLSRSALEGWALERLMAMTEEQLVQPGDKLWSAGKPVEWLYFMRDGEVRLTRDNAPPWTFKGQWVLGSFECARGADARHDATALTQFYSLRLPARRWLGLLEDNFALARAALTAATGAVASLSERVPDGVVTPYAVPSTPLSEPSLGAVGRLALLASLPITKGAGVQALGDLALASTEVALKEGDRLFEPGTSRDSFFVVTSGTIEARRALPDVTRRHQAGDIIGGAAAFTERAAHWEANAVTAARVIAVPLETWFDVMEDHFALVHAFFGALQNGRERALDWLAEAAGPEGVVLR